jgi:predicted metal-dependent hydrolase
MFLVEKSESVIGKVRVGNQKSRWGSCSSQRVISLNWRILLLDYEIGEYVLFHELAHLKHMNHSSSYWNLLNEWVPEAKTVDRQLSQKGRELMLLGRL